MNHSIPSARGANIYALPGSTSPAAQKRRRLSVARVEVDRAALEQAQLADLVLRERLASIYLSSRNALVAMGFDFASIDR